MADRINTYDKQQGIVQARHKKTDVRGETLADAASAVTDFYTHESVRSDDKAKQFASSEFESGALLKRNFFQVAQDPEAWIETLNHGQALLEATA